MLTFAISVYQLFNRVSANQYMTVHADLQRAHVIDTQTGDSMASKMKESHGHGSLHAVS